jgi:caa(3)-type oxidase subunit IV
VTRVTARDARARTRPASGTLVVACAKAARVAVFFMRLRGSDALTRLAAAGAVLWI